MALTYATDLTAITREYIDPYSTDNIYKSTALLHEVRKLTKSVAGGKTIEPEIEYAINTSSGYFDTSDQLTITRVETTTRAVFNWKNYYSTAQVYRTELAKNEGALGIVNMVKNEARKMEKSMAYRLTTGLFSTGTVATAEGKNISGLRAMCLASNPVTWNYGGISVSDASEWAGVVNSNNIPISLGTLQSMYGDLTDGLDRPTLIVTTQDIFDAMWNEYNNELTLNTDTSKELANLGFPVLEFNHVPIIVDAQCPGTAGATSGHHMFFLNTKYIDWYVNSNLNMSTTDWIEKQDYATLVKHLYIQCQLVCRNRRYQGMFTDLNPTV